MMNTQTLSLKKQWTKLKEENPKIRARQAADELGISEAELLASRCGEETVTRLQGPWDELIKQLETLGYVMALTRNESAVHEKKGIYQNFKLGSHVGLVLDDNIDLRLFMENWHFGFAAPVDNPKGTLHSLQFFDQDGTAVHKVYLMNDEHREAYRKLISDFQHPDQSPEIDTQPLPEPDPELPDQEIDTEGFLQEWSELEDTHDFHPLKKKYNLTRTQALRIGEEEFTRKVSSESTRRMLLMAADLSVPIMVFVRNRGVIQIHSGPIYNVKATGNWINVLDEEFNLHLREDHIDRSWVVKKPTEDGIVTSLEVFDSQGNHIATFFGQRKPGNPELEEWRNITSQLTQD